jgi:1-acyl-sn-glycerol-3-phosphate acyltransferase
VELSAGAARALQVQRWVAAVATPITATLGWLVMRFGMAWRIEGAAAARAEFQRARRFRAPLLVCANHLTMLDSVVITWALGSPWDFIRHPSAAPWNLPDRATFAGRAWQQVLLYVVKCVPIPRGGDRSAVADVLHKLEWILRNGEVGLVFPEGGRSRSGRVERDVTTYGVGRVLTTVPDCRVLAVYLRGEGQGSFTRLPARGERFHVSVSLLEPKSDARGLRRSLDLTRQVVGRIADLEDHYFKAHPVPPSDRAMERSPDARQ